MSRFGRARVAVEQFMHPAWIEDTNRFALATPPAYFLQRLYDYDSQLVVVPSRKTPKYLIARRRVNTAGWKSLAGQIDPHPDTVMLDTYGLLPITSMVQTGFSWDADKIIRELWSRDTWAHGIKKDPDALVDRIEAQETAAVDTQKQATRDDLDYRSRDAWRSYQARTGASTIRHIAQRVGARLYSFLSGSRTRTREVHDPSEPAWRVG